jgi:hypothetical protein
MTEVELKSSARTPIVITSMIGQEKFEKIVCQETTELSCVQYKNRGEKVRLLGIDTCTSLNDIMEIRCIKCTRSEQVYDV